MPAFMKSKRKKQIINGQIQNYKRADIIWIDIMSDNSWMSTERATKLKPCECHTLAYILSKGNRTLITFGDWYKDEEENKLEIGNINIIPIQNVKKINYL